MTSEATSSPKVPETVDSRRKLLWWVLGFSISAVFGYFAFREIRWNVLAAMLGKSDKILLASAAAIVVLSFCLRAVRWKFLLPETVGASYRTRFSGVVIGYFVSNFLPARLGDIVRPAYLARRSNADFSVSLLSIVGERVWDLMILVVLFLVFTSTGLVELPAELQIDRRLLIATALAGVVALLTAHLIGRLVLTVVQAAGLARLAGFVSRVLEAFDNSRRGTHRLRVLAVTLVIFAVEIAFFAAMLHAVRLPVTLFGCALVMVVTALSFLLPSAPGGVGVYHFFCQMALVAVGVAAADAIAAAVLVHGTLFAVVTLVGAGVIAVDRRYPDRHHPM